MVRPVNGQPKRAAERSPEPVEQMSDQDWERQQRAFNMLAARLWVDLPTMTGDIDQFAPIICKRVQGFGRDRWRSFVAEVGSLLLMTDIEWRVVAVDRHPRWGEIAQRAASGPDPILDPDQAAELRETLEAYRRAKNALFCALHVQT